MGCSYRSAWEEVADWWWITGLPGFVGGTLGLTIGAFGIHWRRRGLAFPSQPGHGLLIVWLITYCFGLLWQLPFVFYVAISGAFDENNIPAWAVTLWQWQYYTSLLLAVGLHIWLAWWIRPLRRWQVFFLLCALHFSASYVERLYWFTLFGPIENLEFVGPLLAMAVSYVLDHASLLFPSLALLVAVMWDLWRRHPATLVALGGHCCLVLNDSKRDCDGIDQYGLAALAGASMNAVYLRGLKTARSGGTPTMLAARLVCEEIRLDRSGGAPYSAAPRRGIGKPAGQVVVAFFANTGVERPCETL